MEDNLDIYTGTLEYKDIEFSFVFDKTELRLIPPKGKGDDIFTQWFTKEVAKGMYIQGDPPKIEAPYLVGKCSETQKTIVFITKQNANIGFKNHVFFVELFAYIMCDWDIHGVSKLTITSPELDCIYPVSQGYNCSFDRHTVGNTGVFSITTEDFSVTTTEKQSFKIDETDVTVSFGISRKHSSKVGDPPLTLHSTMILEFQETDDFSFVMRVWHVAKEFLHFMCYRRNVNLQSADLSTPTEGGKTQKFATLYPLDDVKDYEPETLQKGRYINLSFILGSEGNILNDIASRTLYTRHIPETHISGNRINAARFIMITAAFEWEFGRAYPEGITKSKETLEVEATATAEIEKLIENSTGAIKKKYKFLRKLVKSDSLQSEIIQVGKDLDDIIGVFGKRLYALNKTELIYSEMGERLSDQRNHYAHGDLDIDFIDLSLLDVVYMERILYAMQLKYHGVTKGNIQKAINALFRCGIMLTTEES